MTHYKQICRMLGHQLMRKQARLLLNLNAPIDHSHRFTQFSTSTCALAKGNRRKVKNVNIFKTMTIEELATTLEKPTDHVFECLLDIDTRGKMENENSALDLDVIRAICQMSGVRANLISRSSLDKKVEADLDVYSQPPPDPSVCKPRPPVVTIMGHVDHGKTTLLDYLRKSNIVDQEFGGITQHIGAFSVKLKNGKSITFLDTPGHAAFSAMRGRGAKLTDIIVLVVSADDGVMPQTIESIKHARNSKVPIIVAINKCDKPEAEVEACVQDLAQHDIVLEEIGGDVMGVKISALKGTGVDALQDSIIALAEMLDIKADHNNLVEARVIEAKSDPGRGKVASVLIQRGTLKVGNYLVASDCCAKVRAIYDENRKQLKSAGPGLAVEISGWKDLPSPGYEVLQIESEPKMKSVVNFRKLQEQKLKEDEAWEHIKQKQKEHRATYEQALKIRQEQSMLRYTAALRRQISEKIKPSSESDSSIDTPTLSILIKADVDGSMEAITSCLDSYADDLCTLDLLNAGVGNVTENDVELANISGGVIIAFNLKVPEKVSKLASEYGVLIRHHNIIYKLFDDVKDMLNEKVPPRMEQATVGEAVIQKIFIVTEKIDGQKTKVPIAGCRCLKGTLYRDKKFKLLRGIEVIHDGKLLSLKHFKTEVPDIKEGMECGLALEDASVDIQEDDILLCYDEFETKPEITWTLPF